VVVEPLSQQDPRWKYVVLGENTGHLKTIGNWGCLLVVYNMLARYYGFTEQTPGYYNIHMVASGAFSNQYLLPAAFRTAHPNRVYYNGFLSRESPLMIPRIAEYLSDGILVPARVDFKPVTSAWEQHWVLLIQELDGDYLMADPWTGTIGSLSETYGIAGTDVLEAIFYTLT
jgi:hypothetical protein